MEYPVLPRNIFKRILSSKPGKKGQEFNANKQSPVLVLLYLCLISSKKKNRRGYVEPDKFIVSLCAQRMKIDRKSVYNGLSDLEQLGFIHINHDGSIFILNYWKGFVTGFGGSFVLPDLIFTDEFLDLPWVLQRAFLYVLYRTTSKNKIIRIGAGELMKMSHLNCPGRVEEELLKPLQKFLIWQNQEERIYEITLNDTNHVIDDTATLDELYPETFNIVQTVATKLGFKVQTAKDMVDLLQLTLQYSLSETVHAIRIFLRSMSYDKDYPAEIGAYLRGIIRQRRKYSFINSPFGSSYAD